MNMGELRSFVQESTWAFAKSMPQTPHAYIHRRNAKCESLFQRVVICIRQVGYQQSGAKPLTLTSKVLLIAWQQVPVML